MEELNSTFSGDGSGLLTNDDFSCLNTDMLSRTMITNRSFWSIREELHSGTPYVAAIIFIFFLVSFFWNLFIIVTYFVKYRLLKEPANIFLLSLAFYYVISTIFLTLFSFIINVRREYVFGSNDVVRCATCDMVGFFFVFVVEGSVHLLMFLSIDRFILLSRPLRYKKIMKRWVAVVIVAGVTIYAFIVAIMPIAFGFGQYEFNTLFGICLARFTGESRAGFNNLFYFTFLIVEGLVPLFVLLATNVFTYRIVRKFLKRNFRRRSTYRNKAREVSEDAKKYQQQQSQLVRVFGALFIANAISWTPVVIVTLLANFLDPDEFPEQMYVFGWISLLTISLFHPILESFFIKDLRLVVNRAKKNVRRASTLVIRQSSKFIFGGRTAKALDEANARMDLEEISTSGLGTSMGTEAYDMSTHFDAEASTVPNGTGWSHDDEEFEGDEDGGENGGLERPQSLRKVGRSVTFSEEVNGPSIPSPVGIMSKPSSVLKKKGGPNRRKQQKSPPPAESIIEEEEEVFGTSKADGKEDKVLSSSSQVAESADEHAENSVGEAPTANGSAATSELEQGDSETSTPV